LIKQEYKHSRENDQRYQGKYYIISICFFHVQVCKKYSYKKHGEEEDQQKDRQYPLNLQTGSLADESVDFLPQGLDNYEHDIKESQKKPCQAQNKRLHIALKNSHILYKDKLSEDVFKGKFHQIYLRY